MLGLVRSSLSRVHPGSLLLPKLAPFSYRPAFTHLRTTMSADKDGDSRVEGLKKSIRAIPDWPKKGIMFRDVTTLLLEPKAFQDSIDMFVERYKGKGYTAVAGTPRISTASRATISEEYTLEYGTDKIEMHLGAVGPEDKVLLVDDLVATGGTLGAGIRLIGTLCSPHPTQFVNCSCSRFPPSSPSPVTPVLFFNVAHSIPLSPCCPLAPSLSPLHSPLFTYFGYTERAGAQVEECACVIELPDLKVRLYSLGLALVGLVICVTVLYHLSIAFIASPVALGFRDVRS
ncbi:unnamed protein product [Closterium sp. NIES-53]